MKRNLVIGLAAACLMSGGVMAQDGMYLGQNQNGVAASSNGVAAIPEGVLLVELERWVAKDDSFSVRPAPSWQVHPGRREGVLGFVSFTEFPGSVPLYHCIANDYSDRFTSRQADCEGHIPMASAPITGNVSPTPLPGTVALYRCLRTGLSGGRWGDHFDSTDSNCEGVRSTINEGVMGYIWQ
ncbi:MAG: hypothetical protein ACREPD_08600 [Stenotrophomonas sp.]|uniref:hypothetical protein n=1 Tax=Stenotrophomonas sp. TaxID=69392 RepID=UPI003D6CB3C8